MRFLTLYFLLLISGTAYSQSINNAIDTALFNKANTAKEITYLSSEEKSVILYLNILRSDPKLFLKNFVKPYLDSTKENNSYTKSLIKTLEKTEPMPLLQPQKDLSMIAKEHAIRSGKENTTGHGNFKERTSSVNNKYGGYLAENCDYGNHSALEIVMELLIDTGIKDLGHRKNILNSKYKNIGVSIKPHKRYKLNCVIDLGG